MYGESIIAVHIRDFLLPKIPFGRPRGDGRRSRARRLRCGHEEMYDIDAIRGLDGFWVGWEEAIVNCVQRSILQESDCSLSIMGGGKHQNIDFFGADFRSRSRIHKV
jgi:hypothetical protein